jgi:2-dehydro-3-deoxyphosphooctonate aldolase (KDO 8-P synthase)
MAQIGYPVVMDATHSVQLPSAGSVSGGNPVYIKPLAKAAAAVGIDALFLEVHPDPENAMSDAASQLNLNELPGLLDEVISIDRVVKKNKIKAFEKTDRL